MGGLGIQQLFVLTFFAFAIRFHYTILREGLLDALIRKRALTLLYTLYVCLTLITVSQLRYTSHPAVSLQCLLLTLLSDYRCESYSVLSSTLTV